MKWDKGVSDPFRALTCNGPGTTHMHLAPNTHGTQRGEWEVLSQDADPGAAACPPFPLERGTLGEAPRTFHRQASGAGEEPQKSQYQRGQTLRDTYCSTPDWKTHQYDGHLEAPMSLGGNTTDTCHDSKVPIGLPINAPTEASVNDF